MQRISRNPSHSSVLYLMVVVVFDVVVSNTRKGFTSMLDILRHLTRSKQWVSRLVLISFTLHLVRFSALPARPLLVNSGKPHGAITYSSFLYQ